MLFNVLLDERYDSEIRAGATWGLGEQKNKMALSAIIKSFSSVEESIKIEASRALSKLTEMYSSNVLDAFGKANSDEFPGIAWALSKADNITLDKLITYLDSVESRQWISYIIGMQGEEKYVDGIEKLKKIDPEVYFATTLLWKIITSWVNELKEY